MHRSLEKVPPPSGPLLSLCDVTVRYGGDELALQSTKLDFNKRELVVLLGASGAGKSSLLRAINGLAAIATGQITHGGIGALTTTAAVRAARRRTGMIFQQHQLVRRMTAIANVLHGRLGRYPAWRTWWPLPRADRQLALHCLERVGLPGKALARVDQLSGGEQQRVGIARALAQEPQLLLADEPVASLDPATASRLMELLREVARSDSMLAIVSLHQVEMARQFGDRIIGLRAGGVVFDGPPAALDRTAVATIYDVPPSFPLSGRPGAPAAVFHPTAHSVKEVLS